MKYHSFIYRYGSVMYTFWHEPLAGVCRSAILQIDELCNTVILYEGSVFIMFIYIHAHFVGYYG